MAGIGNFAQFIPQNAGRILGDLNDIALALGGQPDARQAAAPAQQQTVARPADGFQAPAGQQQAAAGAGGNAQINQALQQIMAVLQELTQLLGGGKAPAGGQQQAQAPAVGTGNGAGAPAGVGQQAPGQQAQAPAPQAPAPQAGAAGQVAPQGGVNQSQLLHGAGTTLIGIGEMLQALSGQGAPPVNPPNPTDSGGVSGSVGDSAVTSAGGTKVECLDKYHVRITEKDGTVTDLSGDPHVKRGDQAFDFKKDSTFVAKDGTRVNFKTKDLGNGTSVIDSAEVLAGGQRALMTGIADGQGKVAQVDKGPAQLHTDQTFVEGNNNKWGINGKEIEGFTKPDEFKLGADLQPSQQAATAAAQAGAQVGGAAGA
ncbi:MAG TPA: DUF1521 domain-containing protein, partial [Myxococcales bacterium]|nr:DUF1521 domain-containing protein [Myxococcales bacterium]